MSHWKGNMWLEISFTNPNMYFCYFNFFKIFNSFIGASIHSLWFFGPPNIYKIEHIINKTWVVWACGKMKPSELVLKIFRTNLQRATMFLLLIADSKSDSFSLKMSNLCIRDGLDIRFSIRYPEKSSHFSYPVSGRIPDIKKPDIQFPNIRPDIRQTGY